MTCDFSVAHYRDLLRAARAGGYRFAGYDRPPQAGDLILRHDVDLSPAAAVALAEVEAEEGAWSTWFLMSRSALYNLASAPVEAAVERLLELGHRVAHHAVWPDIDVDSRFDPVLTWHNPEPDFMAAEVAGLVNAMAPAFFDPDHYRSDSNQHWRHGCPHDALAAGSFEWLQLLIHPEIWIHGRETMRQTMDAFLDTDRSARRELLRADRIDLT